jgi:hypothetical protein
MFYGTDLNSYNLFCDVICVYFGTATYVDYLTFLTLIRLLTQPHCERALTGGGSRVYPNDQGSPVYPNNWGSRVHPNNRGSQVYPNGWGSRVYPNGWGSQARPGWAGGVLGLCPRGLRYALAALALPLQCALGTHGLGFALTTTNKFIYYN